MNVDLTTQSGSRLPVAVILDIDGTLLDSSAVHAEAASKAFATLAIELDDRPLEAYRHFTDWGVLDELMIEKAGRNVTPAERTLFEKALLSSFIQATTTTALQEIAGAADFVSELLADPAVLPVFATGSSRGAAELKLRAIGVDPANVILRTGSEHISREDIILSALQAARERLGLEDIAAISIGDGLWDERTALGLDIPFIGVGGDATRFRLAIARAVRDLTELAVDHVIGAARPFRFR